MFYRTILRATLILIALFFIKVNISIAQTGSIVKWVVEKNSKISVRGKTNINSFTCSVNEYARTDTLISVSDPARPVSFTGEIQMDILSFTCHSNMITNGFRNTLKADKYPTMAVRFISLQSMPALQSKTELIKGLVEVRIAGVIKRFELSYSFIRSGITYMQLNSVRSFHFSDFGLMPPRKFGGLIKIKDDFDVNFQLILRTI